MTQDVAEWKTRKERIDKKLKSLTPAWSIIRYKEGMDTSVLKAHAVEEYPTQNGPADYALFVAGRLLGILEAKRVGVGPQNVLEQAKRYAKGVTDGSGNWNGVHVPFLYSSNGELIFHADVRSGKITSRQLANFHTPAALADFFAHAPDSGHAWLKTTPNTIDKLRDYQKNAIADCESAIAAGKRQMLVAMATGTGKTFMTVAQVYRLLESKSARRVLFLVDRKALAAQAIRAFASFQTPRGNKFDQEYEVYSQKFRKEDFGDDEPYDPKLLPTEYLTKPDASKTFVYVCTIQRMAINLLGKQAYQAGGEGGEDDEDADKLDIPIHAFDVVVADECHRGYTSKETGVWRQVLDYFDAVKIGLTATPAAHSLTLFREVVYRYTTDEAINDGWLVEYEPVKINSNVRMQGAFLREGELVGRVDTDTGVEKLDELEDERDYDSGQIEKDITAPDSNRKIIEEIAKYAYAHETETGRFPKILIFAANDIPHTSHAQQLVNIAREVFSRGDDFVQKITGAKDVDRPLQRIREFRNRPEPKIVVTVDMLSTGVDVPVIEFIVFLRPVKSRILWTQMLGRGTRRCDAINKKKFVIFDCFNGTLIEYFKNSTDFKIEMQKDTVPLEEVIENIYNNVDRDYHVKVLVRRLRRIERDMSGEARERFAAFIPDGDIGKFAGELPNKLKADFSGVMKLLRDKNVQDLLLNYPRAKRTFLKGYEVQDTVSSELVFRMGSEYKKPEDYLVLFDRFVKEHQDEIDAIRILLARPKKWNPKALDELKKKLEQNQFRLSDLQKAHRLVYHKDMADIISMIKHAVRKEEPVLSAEERVDRAMSKVTSGKTFTDEQRRWLDLIRHHLAENLTLDQEDFDLAPIFEQRGGLAAARKVFRDQFEPLIEEINYALAA